MINETGLHLREEDVIDFIHIQSNDQAVLIQKVITYGNAGVHVPATGKRSDWIHVRYLNNLGQHNQMGRRLQLWAKFSRQVRSNVCFIGSI